MCNKANLECGLPTLAVAALVDFHLAVQQQVCVWTECDHAVFPPSLIAQYGFVSQMSVGNWPCGANLKAADQLGQKFVYQGCREVFLQLEHEHVHIQCQPGMELVELVFVPLLVF